MTNSKPFVRSGADWVNAGMNYKVFRDLGFTFALRYAVPSIAGKMVTRSEIDTAHRNSVDVGLIYETTGRSWESGRIAGERDGNLARGSLDSLHAPTSVACYHAVDSQVADSQMDICMEWLAAVRDLMRPYRTGVYGQFSVMEAAYKMDPSIYRWQTQAWSDRNVSQHVDILQLTSAVIGNVNVDHDIAYTPYFGQWSANPGGQPHPQEGKELNTAEVHPIDTLSMAMPGVAPTKVVLFCDIGMYDQQIQKARVAFHSAAKAYSQISSVEITTNAPIVVTVNERDVDAISFHRDIGMGEGVIGVAVY